MIKHNALGYKIYFLGISLKKNVCTLINEFTYVQLHNIYLTLYLRVALLVSFLELPFGGPELGVD